jgi:hypothetical protein
MKAIIHTELRCGSCGQMMQYHKDVIVRCVNLKCDERNKEYKAPAVELESLTEEKTKRKYTKKADKADE